MPKFNVPDMSCSHCKAAIERAVTAADPAATLVFDMDARRVEISSSIDAEALSGVLDAEGYPNTLAR